ncbi:MAG: co-chaperone GroES [Tissierellia bacterium]|nr:co-chaperone GroES [Tissierellia bacterium]
MKIRPLADRVVLEKIVKEDKTVSGIILGSAKDDQADLARVVEISESLSDKVTYKIGDKVLYSEYAAKSVKDQDKEYLVIKNSDILAVIE